MGGAPCTRLCFGQRFEGKWKASLGGLRGTTARPQMFLWMLARHAVLDLISATLSLLWISRLPTPFGKVSLGRDLLMSTRSRWWRHKMLRAGVSTTWPGTWTSTTSACRDWIWEHMGLFLLPGPLRGLHGCVKVWPEESSDGDFDRMRFVWPGSFIECRAPWRTCLIVA